MLKIRHNKGNNYVINGCRIIAASWKDALAEYLSVYSGGARPIFGTNIKA